MAAGVLNTPMAIEVSIFIVRAFVHLRQMLLSHEDLSRKLAALERKYDSQFKVVFDSIRELMVQPQPPASQRKMIGFGLKEPRASYRKKEAKKSV